MASLQELGETGWSSPPESGSEDAVTTPLVRGPVGSPAQTAVYSRRFLELFLLTACSFNQSCIWATYSPVEGITEDLYGWSSTDIKLLAAWGPIFCLPLVLFMQPLVDRLGLRNTVTVAALFIAVGAGLRCLTTVAPYALGLAHTAQILNSLAGPLVLATPTRLSATWFPPHRRTTATSVAIMGSYLGAGVGS